ncbi:polysaccharide deacetylase family protein [Actinoplanes sp. LDG1-06]|uniref:Polysaccharide deacetylase family protein n=1 Tax=Paractinoplanes ovalisporus TaxID=2810368 RepID=A0ABS2AGL6_9ACTN|nr:polysaccharide deacetylase family protein [Actinoplanes ovalisporus]MBM2618975.1 polysaccharide deacetylase family protein [Actinoplanes ovalisporus]
MRLSRARKAILVGVLMLVVGVTGRASADTTKPQDGRLAKAPVASAPASTPPAPVQTEKPKPKPKPKPTKTTPAAKPAVNARYGGPAGSHTLTGTKGVALTFDDGPDPAETPKLLKLLAQHHVKATFCLVGSNAARHPELVRKIVAGGHTLCNHTWNHSLKLGKDPAAKIRADLQRTNAAILKAAPKAKIKYFRAPGGNFTPRLVAVADQMHMTSIYWQVDPRDWSHRKGETSAAHQAKVISSVAKHCRPGAIVLSHDYAQPDTIAAYRKLIPWLKKRYTLVALP